MATDDYGAEVKLIKTKGLGKKVLNVVKNSWKAIPVVGYLNYHFFGLNKDKEKGVSKGIRGGKYAAHVLWTYFGIFYPVGGIVSHEWNLQNQIKFYVDRPQNKRTLEKYELVVTDFVDKNHNGLSYRENYKIKELMDLQDSSKTYIPTLEDWKRAYFKIHAKREAENLKLGRE